MRSIICSFFLFILSTLASAHGLHPGTYWGEMNCSDMTFYVRPIPGRDGSFLGILNKSDKEANIYLIDKYNANKYGLVPFKVLNNNIIGADDQNPTLVLTVNADRGADRITVVPNNGSNTSGFNSPMTFKYKDKENKSQWVNHLSGSFNYNGRSRAATLTAQDINRESSLSIKSGVFPGDYTLREVRPGLHLMLRSSLTTMGLEVSEQTSMIVYFTLEGSILSRNHMVLVDTNTGATTVFKQRH